MDQQGFEVSGRIFRNRMDYQAALRDKERIEKLREKTDFTIISQVSELKKSLEDGRYHLETLLGDDFYDEVCEMLDDLKKQQSVTYDSSVNKKESKKKKTTKDNDKAFNQKKGTLLDDYDEAMKLEIVKQLKIQERRHKALILILAIFAIACFSYVGFYYFYYEKNNIEYDKLAELKDETTGLKINLTENKEAPPMLKKYETLYKKNKRLIGWLKIDDTNIDYPVMQTGNNEYYLDHNFNQEYDKNGSLFLDKDCNAAFPNTNMIIYGHHMKTGNMFGNLNYYSKESYYKEHPQIRFDTIYEEGLYDIMYVFRSRIYNEEEIVFKYYQFFDVTSEDEFYSYMEEMAKLSLYDTGVMASYGDRLITLSTCDSSEEDGRFVVVAKKVK